MRIELSPPHPSYPSLREPAPPTIYLPVAQAELGPLPFFNVLVRPSTDTPAGIARSVAAAISDVDRDLALTLRPMAEQVNATFNQERVLAILAGSFSGLANPGGDGFVWRAGPRGRSSPDGIRRSNGTRRRPGPGSEDSAGARCGFRVSGYRLGLDVQLLGR